MRITANVVHYNCKELVYKTIDSVLMQDYDDIELIVRDDHTPGGFDVDAVRTYIDAHKGENIRRVMVVRGEENVGTVRNLELMRELGQGDVEISIAGDDAWADEHVFSDFAKVFRENSDVSWVISQVDMMDDELKEHQEFFVSDSVKRIVQSRDRKAIWNMVVRRCVLPGLGAAYKRSFFEKVGQLSDSYYLIEDYTSHLRALRQGLMPYYLDRTTALHRSGGISHGNKRYFSRTQILYFLDSKRTFEREILPYRDMIDPDAFSVARTMYRFNDKTFHNATEGLFSRGIVKEEDDLRHVSAEDIQKYGEKRYLGIRRSIIRRCAEWVLRLRVIAVLAVLTGAFTYILAKGFLQPRPILIFLCIALSVFVTIMLALKCTMMVRTAVIQHRIQETF